MHLGIDASRAFKREKTGVEWYSYELIRELVRTKPPECTITLYTNHTSVDCPEDLLAYCKQLRWPPKRLWSIIRLTSELFFHPPDVLFIPSSILPLWFPKHSIVTIHDVAYDRIPTVYGRYDRLYHRWATRRAVRYAHILVPSQWAKHELLELYNANEKQVSVTPLAPTQQRATQPFNTSDHSPISASAIVYVGRLEAKKNIRTLVRSYAALFANSDPPDLALIGKPGIGYQEIIKEISHLPPSIRSHIHVSGYLSQAALEHTLSSAAILVIPSLYEGFGLPILEAFAHNIPVIASKIPAMMEVGGDACLWVDPYNEAELTIALHKLLDDPTYQQMLRTRGTERLRLYSWQRTAQKTWQAIIASTQTPALH